MTKDSSGWIAFLLLLILVLLLISVAFTWLWYIYTPALLVIFFIDKYKHNPKDTLWVTLLITLTVLFIIVGVLTFSYRLHFITGTEWKRLDPASCEKIQEFVGFGIDDCNNIIRNYLEEEPGQPHLVNGLSNYSMNHSLGLIINPKTIPQCYREVCK